MMERTAVAVAAEDVASALATARSAPAPVAAFVVLIDDVAAVGGGEGGEDGKKGVDGGELHVGEKMSWDSLRRCCS